MKAVKTELFQGPPKELKDRIDVLIAEGAKTMNVILTSEKSWYLIIWS